MGTFWKPYVSYLVNECKAAKDVGEVAVHEKNWPSSIDNLSVINVTVLSSTVRLYSAIFVN